MDIFYAIVQVFLGLWWLWLPVLLIAVFIELWVKHLETSAKKALKWTFLEVKISRNIEKSPKSMEQIFSGLHGVLTKVKFLDKYWKGKVQEWFSFEIAGIDGAVYFFIRTPEHFRTLVEAQVHAQYPDAEISEVLDYAGPVAKKAPGKTYDIGGAELILDKDDFYPIRTYPSFEEKEVEQRVDTMASFLEILSKLKPGENIFIQCIIAPTADKKWKEKGQEFINKLMGKKVAVKENWLDRALGPVDEFVINLIKAILIYPIWGEPKKEETKTSAANLTSGEKAIIEAVENKMAKLAFKINIRFGYIARSDIYNRANMAAVNGAFRQFNTLNLNAFKGDGGQGTSVDQPRIIPFIKKRREYLRKVNFIDRLVNRKFGKKEKVYILNIEELATVYHYPILTVLTPTLRRVEAKKAEPPVGLPIG